MNNIRAIPTIKHQQRPRPVVVPLDTASRHVVIVASLRRAGYAVVHGQQFQRQIVKVAA